MSGSQKSSITDFRTTYLFLGIYLVAKTDSESCWIRSYPEIKYFDENIKLKDFMKSFSRMETYFEKQLNNLLNSQKKPDFSINQFELALKYFCRTYEPMLGYTDNKNSDLDIDYNSYLMFYPNGSQKGYISWVEEELKKYTNPFVNENVMDFLQLLRINYSLTGNRDLKDYLENMGRNFIFQTMHITKPKKESVRWPNKDILKDQKTFLWILDHPDKTLTDLNNAYMDEYYSCTDSYNVLEYNQNRFNKFRGEYFPIYYWFFRFLLKRNTINLNVQDIKKYLFLINSVLYEMYNIVGSKQTPAKKNLNQDVLGFTSLNDLGNLPDLPF